MRTIVYDSESGEPITAINLDRHLMEKLREVRYLDFAVIPPIKVILKGEEAIPPPLPPRVTLEHGKGITPSGAHFDMLFTKQSEMALLMKPTMLAGQSSLLEKAFEDGVRDALNRLLRLS